MAQQNNCRLPKPQHRADPNACSEGRQVAPSLFFLDLSAAFKTIDHTLPKTFYFSLASSASGFSGYPSVSLAAPAGFLCWFFFFSMNCECWNSSVKMRQCSLSPLLSFLSLFCHPTLLAISFKYGLYAIDFQIDISTWDSSLNSNSYIQLSNQHFHLHGQLMSTLAHPKWNPDLPFPGLSSPPFSSFPVAQAKSFKVPEVMQAGCLDNGISMKSSDRTWEHLNDMNQGTWT